LNYHLFFEGKSLSTGSCAEQLMQGNLSQVACVTPSCIREHAMASLLFILKPLGLSPFPHGNQSCYLTLPSSPMTDTSLCVLDHLVMGGMESGLAPFLEDGELVWTQLSL